MYEPAPGKDSCGVFAMMKRKQAPQIPSSVCLTGIEAVEFRGSNLGAGFAAFSRQNGRQPNRLQLFVESAQIAEEVRSYLFKADGIRIQTENELKFISDRKFGYWEIFVEAASDDILARNIWKLNDKLKVNGHLHGRVYSSGRLVRVFKEVGFPRDVAKISGLLDQKVEADLWLAHTRQPTNSPGMFPVWSHPFAFLDCAIIHNGDISSFGANMEFLASRGVTSLVGTDSEVVTHLLDYLVRVEGLSIEDAAMLMSNPYNKWLDRMPIGRQDSIRQLIVSHKSACLDGPFTVIAGYADGNDTYMLGLIDRSKFRPIIVGEDEENLFIASEECSIRAISPHAHVWTPEPGSFVLASLERGFIERGRATRNHTSSTGISKDNSNFQSTALTNPGSSFIDAAKLSYKQLNSEINKLAARDATIQVVNVNGQRYIGVNLQQTPRIILRGFPGNCLANFNEGADFIVYGNVADDVADAMQDGKIVIHGDARDVLGQAIQGGKIFVKGNVGNRCVIQMREYQDKRPVVIVGGTADDYFGEYMAGGIAVVLNLWSKEERPVGDFAGTGMVGGRIYVRGRVSYDRAGMLPPRQDILNYLDALVAQGQLAVQLFRRVEEQQTITLSFLTNVLPSSIISKIKKFFEGKYTTPLQVEQRTLGSEDRGLLEPQLKEFFQEFGLDDHLFREVLSSEYTTIGPRRQSLAQV